MKNEKKKKNAEIIVPWSLPNDQLTSRLITTNWQKENIISYTVLVWKVFNHTAIPANITHVKSDTIDCWSTIYDCFHLENNMSTA